MTSPSSVVRVMDSRMSAVSGGVSSVPRRIMKKVAPVPSATVPLWFSKIGESYPSALACSVASRPFW